MGLFFIVCLLRNRVSRFEGLLIGCISDFFDIFISIIVFGFFYEGVFKFWIFDICGVF